MDTVKGFFLWPFVNIYLYMRFGAGCAIAVGPALFRLATKGPKSLSRFVDQWNFFKRLPLGRYVFGGLAGLIAPYSGSITAEVQDLSLGDALVAIHDYPWLRNPFQSIHAVALANLGELATGLAMFTQLQAHPDLRGIPHSLKCEYVKKARGTIRAHGQASLADVSKDGFLDITAKLYDAKGDVVCVTTVTWNVKEKSGNKK